MSHREIAHQYALRREAALRLPVLEDGYHDPDDKYLEQSRPIMRPDDICQHVADGRPVTREDLRAAWQACPDARPMLEEAAVAWAGGWD